MQLAVAVDGEEWTRVGPPRELGARAWMLGVIAVQIGVEDGRARAQLRASLTGTPPKTRPLDAGTVVQAALVEEGATPAWPVLAPAGLEGHAARIVCFAGAERLADAALPVAELGRTPAPRAFAHVYCRWLRDGGIEPGFDLTDFLSRPPGEMYERKLHRSLAAGVVVGYAVAV